MDIATAAPIRKRAEPAGEIIARASALDQLIAKGKPPKLALTALMRTMLVTLNAMLRARQPWKHPL